MGSNKSALERINAVSKRMPRYRPSGYGVVAFAYIAIAAYCGAIYMVVSALNGRHGPTWLSILGVSALGGVATLMLAREVRLLRREGRLREELHGLTAAGFLEKWVFKRTSKRARRR